jgi:1-acyl-sn-glycerol-3-phosphate acyltransferase
VTPYYLRRWHGITEIEVRGERTLRELQRAGHGIVLTPNHCRMSDAILLHSLAMQARQPFFVMASAHLFRGSRALAWTIRRLGGFSVNREGIDRQAIQKATDILVAGARPLVIFPEGALSHCNEHLNPLQEGVSFIARTAAAKLDGAGQAAGRRIYALPVAIRYVYRGDIEATAGRILTSIEQRLSWRPFIGECLVRRIYRVGQALLALKEQEYFGHARTGTIDERLAGLINHILAPQEVEWLRGAKAGSTIARVRDLRRAILPAMVEGNLAADEVDRRWRQLENASFAQSISLYPPRYVATRPTVDRVLETVERFNEHLCGDETAHGPKKAIIDVGEPIEVSPKRDRAATVDPLLQSIEQSLTALLGRTIGEATMYKSAEELALPV